MPLTAHRADIDGPGLAADVDLTVVGAYRGYAELVQGWSQLANGRPRVIGHTVKGLPLVCIEFGPTDATRVTAMMAGIHPIEWIGVETLRGLLARLDAAPPTDRRVIAFPLVNVDGYRRVEQDLRQGRKRFVRGNANRVDLNRNWPTHFRARPRRRGLFGDYNSPGPRACSEPEVAAVVDTLDRADRTASIDVALSLHSIGRKVMIPYGGAWRRAADYPRLRAAAEEIRARIPTRYSTIQSSRWVPGALAHGMEIDHLYERYGATAILIECSWGGVAVRDPSSWRHWFRIFNPPDPERVVRELGDALEPFIRGAH